MCLPSVGPICGLQLLFAYEFLTDLYKMPHHCHHASAIKATEFDRRKTGNHHKALSTKQLLVSQQR